MNASRINRGAAASIVVCFALVVVGLVRLASYSKGALGGLVAGIPMGYNPEAAWNAQFFKIAATPTVVAVVYFFFRWRNRGRPVGRMYDRIDFRPALLRGIITTVITLHWLVMEWWKFNIEGFYPFSPLENRTVNIGVLLLSQAVAFFGMKYLSFDPVFDQRRKQ
jgi:hypothetical protein